MRSPKTRTVAGAALITMALAMPALPRADPVAVKHWEGLTHSFVELRTLEGTPLADGDLIETTIPTADGNQVTTRFTLRFNDGSIQDETSVYMQGETFRFVSDHLVQKGPAFKTQIESTMSASGQVTVQYSDLTGKENRVEQHLKLPPDAANGMLVALLKNIDPKTPKTTVPFVAITPEPQLVDLEITPQGEERFSTGGSGRTAIHYVLKVHVPGLMGAFASFFGKIPPDSHVWILTGEAPALVKAEMALCLGGPKWQLELLSPVWPASTAAHESIEVKAPQQGKF